MCESKEKQKQIRYLETKEYISNLSLKKVKAILHIKNLKNCYKLHIKNLPRNEYLVV